MGVDKKKKKDCLAQCCGTVECFGTSVQRTEKRGYDLPHLGHFIYD